MEDTKEANVAVFVYWLCTAAGHARWDAANLQLLWAWLPFRFISRFTSTQINDVFERKEVRTKMKMQMLEAGAQRA